MGPTHGFSQLCMTKVISPWHVVHMLVVVFFFFFFFLQIGVHLLPLALNWTVFYSENKNETERREPGGSRGVSWSWLVRRNRLERWLEGSVFRFGELWEAAAVASCTVVCQAPADRQPVQLYKDWKPFNEDFFSVSVRRKYHLIQVDCCRKTPSVGVGEEKMSNTLN